MTASILGPCDDRWGLRAPPVCHSFDSWNDARRAFITTGVVQRFFTIVVTACLDDVAFDYAGEFMLLLFSSLFRSGRRIVGSSMRLGPTLEYDLTLT